MEYQRSFVFILGCFFSGTWVFEDALLNSVDCFVYENFLLSSAIFFYQKIYSFFFIVKSLGRCADDKPYVPIYQVSKEKAKSLGVEFIPLEASVKETVESLKEKGFVSF